MKYRSFSASVLLLGFITSACSSQSPQVQANSKLHSNAARSLAQVPDTFAQEGIPWDFKRGEIKELCKQFIDTTNDRLNAIAAVPADKRSFETTLLPLETAAAEFDQMTSPLVFVNSVHTNEALRDESTECEKNIGEFYVGILTRRDLYNAVKDVAVKGAEQSRLKSETLKGFEKSGLKLSDEKLAQFKKLQEEIANIGAEFSANIAADKSTITFTKEQLVGANDSFLSRLKRDGDKYIVTSKSPDYVEVMENVSNADTRHKMLILYTNRAAPKNDVILKKLITLRQQVATVMGYATWADYVTSSGRMATSGKIVWDFINSLKGKLKEGNQKDFKILTDLKKKLDPKDGDLKPWDLGYYKNQYQKQNFQIDTEKVREYFPSDFVVDRMFEVYSQILGVKFERVKNPSVWSPDVSFYKIYDKKTGELISYFYTDFIPREGKFSHAAAFPLRAGRRLPDGSYLKPIAAIVANLNPPSDGKPSLLSHDDVETLFHEFGHIMHQTLTKAPYASLSGSSVARDFVEAPSQMLENWVWTPSILAKLSGHYQDTTKKLPADLMKRMIDARNFQVSAFNTRQLWLGTLDMTYHSNPQGQVDPAKIQLDTYHDVIGLTQTPEAKMEASWTHMVGYDAGYYGYLWSDVYAADMFTVFAKGGLLSSKVGARYRKTILEQGNMKDSSKLVREFLQREPSNAPFYKKLGIKP